MEQLLLALEQNLRFLPSPAIKYQERLATSAPAKSCTYVYSILHYTTIALDRIDDKEAFTETLSVCICCLEYLVKNGIGSDGVPENGMEKLIYQLVKQTELREAVESLKKILLLLLKLATNSLNVDKQILKYTSSRMKKLNFQPSCSCHAGSCNQIIMVWCKLYGIAINSIAETSFSFHALLHLLMNFCITNMLENHCCCHLLHVSDTIMLFAEQLHQSDFKLGEEQLAHFDLATKFISEFICLFALIAKQEKHCVVKGDKDVSTTFSAFYEHSCTLSQSLDEFPSNQQKVICQIGSKLYNEILKNLAKVASSATIGWSSIIQTTGDMCELQIFLKNWTVDMDIFQKTVFFYYQLLRSSCDEETRIALLCHTDSLLKIIDNKLYGFVATAVQFTLDCAINICVAVWNVRKETEIKQALPISVFAFNTACHHKLQDKVFASSLTLCKYLQRLDQAEKAMQIAGKSIMLMSNNSDQVKAMVEIWLRGKVSLIALSSNKTEVEKCTVADYLSSEMSPTIIHQALFHELLLCRQSRSCKKVAQAADEGDRQHPPTAEYYALCKLENVVQKESNEAVVVQTLLAVLLQAWCNSFQHKSNSYTISSSACKLMDKANDVKWEIVFLAKFTYFIATWEKDLSKVWKEMSRFGCGCNATSSSDNFLKWFPSIRPFSLLNITSLITSSICAVKTAGHDLDYTLEVINYLKVAAIILQLRGEIPHSLATYKLLDELLDHSIDQDSASNEPALFMHWVLTKCEMVRLLCQCGMEQQAMSVSEKAMQLSSRFKTCVAQSKERSEKIKKMDDQLTIEASSSRIHVLLLVQKFSDAEQLMHSIITNEFIDAAHRRTSHTSSFAAARVDIMLADMSIYSTIYGSQEFKNYHFLQQSIHSLKTTLMLLDQCCPGMFQMLKAYDIPTSFPATPTLGRKSAASNSDMLRQFELLRDLFDGLYKVSHLWLSVGDLRFANLYITDGIILSRILLFPERELQFELLLAKLARVECNHLRVEDELVICDEVLRYIDSSNGKPGKFKRSNLHSSNTCKEQDDADDLEKALNNSSIMEDLEDDAISVATVEMDITSTVAVTKINPASSPTLVRRKRSKANALTPVFSHDDACECRLCTNQLLVKQQCLMAELLADHLKTTSTAAAAIGVLENARRVISTFANKQQPNVWQTSQDGKVLIRPELLAEQLSNMAALAEVYFHINDVKSSTMLVKMALHHMSVHPLSIHSLETAARVHLSAGKLLLKTAAHKQIDISPYMNMVIDHLGKKCRSDKVDTEVTKKMKNLSVSSHDQRADKTKDQSLSKPPVFQTPCKSMPPPKRRTTKTSASGFKTPQVKKSARAHGPDVRASVKSSGKKSAKTNKFEIFDEKNVPQISLTTSKAKLRSLLPVPDIAESDDEGVGATPAKSLRSKRNMRSVASDGSDDEKDGALVSETSQCISPAVRTRSRRKVQTRNVMTSRRDARRRHRVEEGPIYTTEECETARPVRRTTRTCLPRMKKTEATIAATIDPDPDCGKDTDEIESVRESGMEYMSPLRSARPNSIASGSLSNEQQMTSDLVTCEAHLLSAFRYSSSAGDFCLIKSAAHHLTLHYASSSRDPWSASACHALSIGTTLRSVFHLSAKVRIKAMEKAMKHADKCSSDLDDPVFNQALHDMVERTHPHHQIKSVEEKQDYLKSICVELPAAWTVCLLSYVNQGDSSHIFITRLRHQSRPLHLQLDGSGVTDILTHFRHLMECNVNGMKSTDKSLWWTQRRKMDKVLGDFIHDLNSRVLGYHRGVMLGCLLDDAKRTQLIHAIDDIIESIDCQDVEVDRHLLEVYLSVWNVLTTEEKTNAICNLLPSPPSIDRLLQILGAFDALECLPDPDETRGHVVLILDKDLQCLPWESTPLLTRHSVSRIPSPDTLYWLLRLNKSEKYGKVDFRSAAYILNPKGDLTKTQSRFEGWFTSIQSWQGLISCVPTQQQWFSYLSEKDIFIFCGHGSGSNFIQREVLARRKSRACALLMGCGSGRLSENGRVEPEGMAISYLLSGSPCVLACLWPVTDKDIDKYLVKCFSSWMKPGTRLSDVIRTSSIACKMPYLNGAACVVYGIPATCVQTVAGWHDNMPKEFRDL